MKKSDEIMKELAERMKKRHELRVVFIDALKTQAFKLKINIYKGKRWGYSSKKINPNFLDFQEFMIYEVIPYATYRGKVPAFCRPCKLIHFVNETNLNPHTMFDLRDIFAPVSDLHTLDDQKLDFANSLYMEQGRNFTDQELLELLKDEFMPLINIPGGKEDKAVYHKCDSVAKAMNSLQPEPGVLNKLYHAANDSADQGVDPNEKDDENENAPEDPQSQNKRRKAGQASDQSGQPGRPKGKRGSVVFCN